ncbi:WS/DGAT/MGAT family O-acyltransferase [Marinobacter litoralis]|uniref:WS/DGAT/MGAT family O-acyltransferase n=1 Tax=Marinobacter litoralis TaxID=187981 RepID=UPI0018EDADB6|nr:wax ester/triacylglycerol synthase family O-acyltransferase [Marinobacter litoralis]MBJ6138670.1 wax ester/triacylglycerol synthase family O-acyltransferase [Marinobacter litoralis]
MHQLSELDASFLYLESETTPMHIGGVYLFDASGLETPVSYATFIQYICSRLHVAPIFRQKLKEIPLRLGRPYWVDDADFSIERHLAYVSLGDRGTDTCIKALAAKILEDPLKRDRPLWQITFVDGFKLDTPDGNKDGFALIVKLHHASIDAFSGEEIMGKLLEYLPAPSAINPPRPWQPRPEPSEERVFLQAGANMLKAPMQLASLAYNTAEAATRGLIQKQIHKLPLPASLFSAPHCPFNRQITGNRKIVSASIELARLKTIKAQLGDVTLNDVVLGICAETLNRYLITQGAQTTKPLVAMTPISVRSSSLRRATGNQMSAMLLNLATNEADPALRIRYIHRNAVESEPYREAIAADRLTELLPSTLLALSARLYSELRVAQSYQPLFNLPITNVPGPQVPMYLQGAKLVQQFNSAPLFDSMGLVIVAVSYEGMVTLNFTLCPDVVSDGGSLESLVQDSVTAIEMRAEAAGEAVIDDPGAGHPKTLSDEILGYLEGLLKKSPIGFKR